MPGCEIAYDAGQDTSDQDATENADAQCSGGARSITKGIKICGVTVAVPTKKDNVSRTWGFLVIAKPIVIVVADTASSSTDCPRRTRPRGDIRRNLTRYLSHDKKL
jgi:hypothetical protein